MRSLVHGDYHSVPSITATRQCATLLTANSLFTAHFKPRPKCCCLPRSDEDTDCSNDTHSAGGSCSVDIFVSAAAAARRQCFCFPPHPSSPSEDFI
ncbi:unnamed protein product [Merluccius merluccius]